ncbi:uncharacterized protein RHIMIDRAFT_250019 [Rhizopus microsporus ATCC 52813]|uniref:Uncharacterized protein n=1 Tax=Rhizopus microsporus ATCC 52813 TaxID=1340429 RepID=A0A2G4SEK5_RHIZD|nr:uncharacterized protein RHIMIDRAFT_250019 [Rhizopus microsporus ATCC 52813]PHZ07221.1 hypothetical protein RHIMIDRAFT_250019 [Rhizopus microsporus ATCC 52813]
MKEISKEMSPELDENWILNGINVSEKFFKYRKNCRVVHESDPTDSINNIDNMLALSSIILLRKDVQVTTFLNEMFASALLEQMRKDILDRCFTKKVFKKRIFMKIEKIMHEFIDKKMDDYVFGSTLSRLAKNAKDKYRPIIRAVQEIALSLPESEIFPVSEGHLAASYVHPMMSSLFRSHSPETVPHVCDKLFDMGQITNGSRPDYISDVYYGGERQYTNVVGETKIEGATKIGIVRDLYRMALFSKEALDQGNLKGVMGFQAIGNRHFVKTGRSH